MTGLGMSPLDLGYAAALIDGEGTLCVERITTRLHRRNFTYKPTVAIKMADVGGLDLMARMFGGRVRPELRVKPSRGPHRRPLFSWDATGARLRLVLEAVRPYLLVKHRQADLLLEFLNTRAAAGHNNRGLPPALLIEYERLRSAVRTLNAGELVPA